MFSCCFRREEKANYVDGPIPLEPNDELQISEFCYGFKMGYGPGKSECQDSLCMLERFKDSCSYFAIYDGHGPSGKEASQATNDYVQTYLEGKTKQHIGPKPNHKDVHKLLKTVYETTEEKLKKSGIDYSQSGTCAVSAFIFKNYCYVSNIGDSRVVLYRTSGQEKVAVQLTIDHRADNNEVEQERIFLKGGKIEKLIHEFNSVGQLRIWRDCDGPGFACTRTIGDFTFKNIGIISYPETTQFELTKEDKFIVLASDGVWEVMTNDEVCLFIEKASVGDKQEIGELLVKECRSRWENLNKDGQIKILAGDSIAMGSVCDDITVIIIWLNFANS